MGSFGPTQLPRRGQLWSKAREQPLSVVRVSQLGSQEAGLLIRAETIAMTTGQPTAPRSSSNMARDADLHLAGMQ